VNCELLEIHPIKMNVTYDVLVEQTPLKLNALIAKGITATSTQLREIFLKHYIRQGKLEVYKLLGTANFLGNPIGLVTNVSSGVKDFFYEPGQAIMHNPSNLGGAIVKGTSSLVGHGVYGAFNTVGKMSNSLSKGVSSLSDLAGDKEYTDQRRVRQHTQGQSGAADSAKAGGSALGRGIFGGVTGLVTAPIKGAQEGGAGGFIRGLGKGLVGAVVKPTAGVLDLATDLSSGVRNSTTVYADCPPRRRMPRAPTTDPMQPITPYDKEKAIACMALAHHRADTLLHTMKPDDGSLVVWSDKRVIFITDSNIESGPEGEAQLAGCDTVMLLDIKQLVESPTGITLLLKDEKKRGKKSKERTTRSLPVIDGAKRQDLCMELMVLVAANGSSRNLTRARDF